MADREALSLSEREEIRAGIEREESLSRVVRRLGRPASTICREVARNGAAAAERSQLPERPDQAAIDRFLSDAYAARYGVARQHEQSWRALDELSRASEELGLYDDELYPMCRRSSISGTSFVSASNSWHAYITDRYPCDERRRIRR